MPKSRKRPSGRPQGRSTPRFARHGSTELGYPRCVHCGAARTFFTLAQLQADMPDAAAGFVEWYSPSKLLGGCVLCGCIAAADYSDHDPNF
jgi:hypothetical protein